MTTNNTNTIRLHRVFKAPAQLVEAEIPDQA
jgi:hypothetical protein